MKSEFVLIYKDSRMRSEWIDKETALEWAEKRDDGGGTIKVSEGLRVDVNEFKSVVSKERFATIGKEGNVAQGRMPVVKIKQHGNSHAGYEYEEAQRGSDGSILYERPEEPSPPMSRETLDKLSKLVREKLKGAVKDMPQ